MKIDDLEVYGIIYKIKNLKNNKIYIGQTNSKYGFKGRYYRSGKNFIDRVKNTYESEIKRGKHANVHLHNSICKYWVDCWEVDDIFDIAFSKEELDYKEWFYIEYYNSTNSNYGYNKREGGNANKCTEETKAKISKNHADCSYGNNSKARRVVCLETRKEYDSVSRASRELNINESGIRNCCYGKSKTAGGYCWLYYEDYKDMDDKDIEKIIINNHTRNKAKNYTGDRFKFPIKYGGDNPSSKKVICVNTGEIFDCIKDAMIKYNIKCSSSIGKCCNGKLKHVGKDENGTLLRWEWYKK